MKIAAAAAEQLVAEPGEFWLHVRSIESYTRVEFPE